MPALLWLGSVLSYLFNLIVNNFLATKIILTTLFIVVLPIILNNFVAELLQTAMNMVSQNLNNYDGSNLLLQFTGLAGWFIQTLKLDSAFSVIVSAIALRFTLNLIPFVRV